MLAKCDAQIDAEQGSGHYSPQWDVYNKMYCSRLLYKNIEGYYWQDSYSKKHYRLKTYHLKRLINMMQKNRLHLKTHNDIPYNIWQQLYTENK